MNILFISGQFREKAEKSRLSVTDMSDKNPDIHWLF